MNISKITKADVPAVSQFIFDIIKNDFGYEYNSNWHRDIDELETTYIVNQKACFFIAEEKGTIVGTIAARPYDKDYAEFVGRYNQSNTLSIWRHYITKDKRGQGIGTQLLKKVEEFAHSNGYTFLYLHTQKTIPGSLEYWLAKGFTKTIEIEDGLETVHLEKTDSWKP